MESTERNIILVSGSTRKYRPTRASKADDTFVA
uniref:Uncharacterized protein n=1 Tax=Arundo donax TaxID=35708 RepID=A0A0A9BYN1_ARUDO